MRWPKKRMRLWHPDSPGVRIDVWVRWPRYLFDPAFATLNEIMRERPAKMDRCISCGKTLTTDWICAGCVVEGARRETEHWDRAQMMMWECECCGQRWMALGGSWMKCIRTETGRWAETRQGLIPLPGACHPAVVDVADSVRSSRVHDVRVVLPRPPIADPEEFEVQLREVVFSRSLACYSERWGIWTWKIWVDDLGRMIAAHEMSWIQRELYRPRFAYAPFVGAPNPHP